jgi:uncharacterized protein
MTTSAFRDDCRSAEQSTRPERSGEEPVQYRAVIHVDQEGDQVFKMALGNVANLLEAITGQEHEVVVLFNGPAVGLLTEARAMHFRDRIQSLAKQGVRFEVCNNALTRSGISRESLIPESQVIPAGIVALIALQEQGFAYVKP